MGDDDVKKLVLARRAKFVAAALVGLSAARCGGQTEGSNPQPCLSQRCEGEDCSPRPCLKPPVDAQPVPCLGVPYEDTGIPDDAGDASDAGDVDPDADDGG